MVGGVFQLFHLSGRIHQKTFKSSETSFFPSLREIPEYQLDSVV